VVEFYVLRVFYNLRCLAKIEGENLRRKLKEKD
jgi:hypothetical protein